MFYFESSNNTWAKKNHFSGLFKSFCIKDKNNLRLTLGSWIKDFIQISTSGPTSGLIFLYFKKFIKNNKYHIRTNGKS